MDINRAKQEIKNSVQAYLAKNEDGSYFIPSIRQRPILLMGPPGIGKTAIMEQAADECGIALVSYTITHHTRQSAIGLPFISKRQFGGKEYTITEYTMSEIIASVYDKMEQTGMQEGILFIDEINCVSETLAPTMLQFLQQKSFGSHSLPEGWIIVAAGNPPEYNKSVRDFDIVTLDRLKRIDVEEDFSVWKKYAYRNHIHPSILSYLEIKKQNFYNIETTVDGKIFVTARGWEDLSHFLQAYERLGLHMDRAVVGEYLQHPRIAADFSAYYDLFCKYQSDYHVDEILAGKMPVSAIERLQNAPFDERLSVISLLIDRLTEDFTDAYYEELFVTCLYHALKSIKQTLHSAPLGNQLEREANLLLHALEIRQKAATVERKEAAAHHRAITVLRAFQADAAKISDNDVAFSKVSQKFQDTVSELEQKNLHCSETLEHAFHFLETTFNKGQELVVFVTELNTNYFSTQFIQKNGSAAYNRNNKELMIGKQRRELIQDISKLQHFLQGF